MKWKRELGSAVQAPISHGGAEHDYVISHREGQHNVSYRPPGHHEHVGTFATEKEAKAAAAAHAKGSRAKSSEVPTGPALPRGRARAKGSRAKSEVPTGPALPRGRARASRPKKSPKQLEREIASSLASSGQPELAALFADPTARATFAKEMRHELYKKQASEEYRAAVTARPFTVKRLEAMGSDKRRVRTLLGNYPTLEAAKEAADRVDGWVERRSDGQVVYGVEKQSDPEPA